MRSRSFLIAPLFLLALLHVYIGMRLLPDLPLNATGRALGVACLIASCLLMPQGLMARSLEGQPWRARLAWAGLLCMGLFSSLLVLTVVRDVVLLGAGLFGAASPALVQGSALAVPVLTGLVTLAGFVNARRVARVKPVDIVLPGLPAALDGFTIAQLSDIHVGPTIRHDYLDRIVRKVNTLQPDLIALTGDLVDGSVRELAPHTAPLGRLSAPHGVYAVTGNHEYYSNAPAWIAEFRRLGLRVLLNEHVRLSHQGAPLLLAGVTDYSAHVFDPSQRSDPHKALAGAQGDEAVKILLAHQPRSAFAAADAGFDLQLSGHTHGGQFWPWNLFVPLQQPFVAGLARVGKLRVYTSRGTGYWGPPKRFGAPSEITLIRLRAG